MTFRATCYKIILVTKSGHSTYERMEYEMTMVNTDAAVAADNVIKINTGNAELRNTILKAMDSRYRASVRNRMPHITCEHCNFIVPLTARSIIERNECPECEEVM